MPLFETWQIIVMCLGGFILASLLVWGILAFLRKGSRRSAPPSPEALALNALQAALELGDDERYAVESSRILLNYLERVRQYRTHGKTTEECLASVRLPGELQLNLKDFLRCCDRAKFALARFTEKERIMMTDTASEIVLGLSPTPATDSEKPSAPPPLPGKEEFPT